MDGLTCVREIRRRQDTGDIIAHIPVVGVTVSPFFALGASILAHWYDQANARNEQIQAAKDAGMVSRGAFLSSLETSQHRVDAVAGHDRDQAVSNARALRGTGGHDWRSTGQQP